MGSRDNSKFLQDRLKVFFRRGASATIPPRNVLEVTPELERELGPETPLHRRLRALKEIGEKVIHTPVQQSGVERIWSCTCDLLNDSNAESRHAALCLMRCIAEGQADNLLIMRTIYFHYLQNTQTTHSPDDDQLRFKLLYTLTNTGRNIESFEEQIGPFLLQWLSQIQVAPLMVECLQLITNIVKFNASYLDEEVVHSIVIRACQLCVVSADTSVVLAGLALLEAVLSYSLLPRAALRSFVATLCRTVNIETYCSKSRKLMGHLVGGDLSHAALQELLLVMEAPDDAGLVRGAVYFVNLALWGAQRSAALRVSALAVLPAYLKALDSGSVVVTCEVVASVQCAVTRSPPALDAAAWPVLLPVLRRALHIHKTSDPPNELIHSRLHALITSIEQLHESDQYFGDVDELLDLIDSCGHERPESSTKRLITLRADALSPTGTDWVSSALNLADRYLRNESRLSVRLHTLSSLVDFIKRYRFLYGEELVGLVGVPVLSACALDAHGAIRAAAARAAARLACGPPSALTIDLVDLLERILNRPFEMYVSGVPIPADADITELQLACGGLVEVLHDKLLAQPAAHPARALLVLLDHLDLHYRRPALFLHHPSIRLQIFEMLFCLRANAFNCVGFCYDSSGAAVWGAAALRLRPVCSPYLLAETGARQAAARELAAGSCVVPLGRAARTLAACLTRETDWAVVARVLRALPALLQARAPVLGRRPHDVDMLACTLCSMISDRSLSFPECLRTSSGQKVLTSEFHNCVLPALCALAPHHPNLEPQTQQRIVRCVLKYGMVLRTPAACISAMTLFTLETRETMVRMLPEVLLDLSKISDTRAIASPMLEFLSTLTRLPKVFASFVEDQYMSVFAILLPYTNPSRYNHYVVSLAHHVVAAWFLKCRLSYRRNFVKFILHGLHNYIIIPFEEQLRHRSNRFRQNANEDSSNRQRSSSLGSKAVSRMTLRDRGAQGAGSSADAAFHVELTETCVDLLARYTSTPVSVKPARNDIAEFLFTGGQSMTWVVGHKIVTITTSGCLQNSIKQGLCERCAALCRQHADSTASPLPPLAPHQTFEAPDLQVDEAEASAENQSDISTASNQLLQPQQDSQPEVKRQNSSENKSTDRLVEFFKRLDRVSKEVDGTEDTWRLGEVAGSCPCWCSLWAEVHVRSPTGDVCWTMRVQNQMHWDKLLECSLQEVAAMLSPPSDDPASPAPTPAPSPAPSTESEARPRSGSEGSAVPTPSLEPAVTEPKREEKPPPVPAQPPPPPRPSTQPINIPSSPKRQGSASTDADDDLLLMLPESKSRHPVRRSNSSPEMSSSWRVSRPAPSDHTDHDDLDDLDDLIVLDVCEPTTSAAVPPHVSKKSLKKSDMRVSCEAIPEEMSGTSPLAHAHSPAHVHVHAHTHAQAGPSTQPTHPHLMTYNSDPGTVPEAAAAAPPQHHHLQKTASDSTVPQRRQSRGGVPRGARDDLPPLARSKRSNTISVMSRTRPTPHVAIPSTSSGGGGGAGGGGGGGASAGGAGITPAFVFLQLYHSMSTYPTTLPVPGETPPVGFAASLKPLAERPLLVKGALHERSVKNLDLVPPIETYKVGVLYVGPGQQDNEVLILKNEYGSVRYCDFLTRLGTVVSLEEGAEEQPHLFINLERGGRDGAYTYVWCDDIMQVLFHVATAMPTTANDPTCNEKRKHIGNDYVSIVYNDSGAEFNISTIKGQLCACVVVVEPYEYNMNRVLVSTRDERIRTDFLAHHHPYHVSDHNVALLARQMALHCSLASQISQSLTMKWPPNASNCLQRLRQIKRLRQRLEEESRAAAAASAPYAPSPHLAARLADFNDYT